MHREEPQGQWAERAARPVLVAAMAASIVLAWPAGDFPLVDDWSYAWSVEHLLRTAKLAIIDLASAFPVTQVAWGAVFALPQGLSFTTLRLSTIVLALVGILAFYELLRHAGARPAVALAGCGALLWNPVYFVLACSFMTDVPFLVLATVALLAWAGALGAAQGVATARRRAAAAAGFWAGSALAVGAFLVRQPAIVLPLGLVAYAAVAGERWVRRAAATTGAGTLLVMAAALAAMPLAAGPTGSLAWRAERLRYLLEVSPWTYLAGVLGASYHIGLAAFPLAVSLPLPRRHWQWAGPLLLGAGVLCACFGPGFPYPLRPRAIWSLAELGGARALVRGEVAAVGRTAPMVRALLVGPALFAQVVLAAALGQKLVRWSRRQAEPADVVILAGLFYVGVVVVLWFFADRYYLPLLPAALLLLAPRLERVRWTTWAAVALLAAVAISGTRDELAYSRALWRGISWLRAKGVPPAAIDAGYPANGWLLYAHPENLAARMRAGRNVPWVTSREQRPYTLANRPLAGYRLLRDIEIEESWWAVSRRLYVLGPEGMARRFKRPGALGGGWLAPGAEGSLPQAGLAPRRGCTRAGRHHDGGCGTHR